MGTTNIFSQDVCGETKKYVSDREIRVMVPEQDMMRVEAGMAETEIGFEENMDTFVKRSRETD